MLMQNRFFFRSELKQAGEDDQPEAGQIRDSRNIPEGKDPVRSSDPVAGDDQLGVELVCNGFPVFVIDVIGAFRIDDYSDFGFRFALRRCQTVTDPFEFADFIDQFLGIIITAPHIEPPERCSVEQRTAELPPVACNIGFFIGPSMHPFQTDMRSQLIVRSAGSVVDLVKIVFTEQMKSSVRTHKSGAAAHFPVIVTAGTDEKVKIRGSVHLFVCEMSALHQPFSGQLQDIAEKCAEGGCARNKRPRFPREKADSVCNAFADETPVTQGAGIGFRIAQMQRRIGAEPPAERRDGIRFPESVFAAPLAVCVQLARQFAPFGIIHPFIRHSTGENITLDSSGISGFEVCDECPHIVQSFFAPAFRGERIAESHCAVGESPHQLTDQPVRGIEVDHAKQFRFRSNGEDIVDLPVGVSEFAGVEIKPVRRIINIGLTERIGGIGWKHAELADSCIIETLDGMQFFAE